MRVLAAFLVSLFLALPAAAQERPNTILVLDGSGSMWGQIDGVAKITIAQQVVADLLGTIPPDQALGLTVYGHRRKGDCSDIETVVAPGAGSRDAIAAAVNAIKPKGKTPMTDAVRAAAEALRYTEEAATVILVSDGIETCNPDPCAAARVLEETGTNFTAHVVGFDVTDSQALAQMRCIAEETGGTFLTAANAAELTTAMTAVAATPPVRRDLQGQGGRRRPDHHQGAVLDGARCGRCAAAAGRHRHDADAGAAARQLHRPGHPRRRRRRQARADLPRNRQRPGRGCR